MGLLNSAGECVRPSLLVLLFSDPPYPAGVVVVVVGPLPITDLILPSSLGGDFHYTTIITKLLSTLGPKFLWKSKSSIKHTFPAPFSILTQEICSIFRVDSEFHSPEAVGPLF